MVRFFWISFVVWMGVCLLSSLSCLDYKAKRSKKGAAGLIDKQNIYTSRASYGTTLVLAFKTQKDALCEFSIWSQAESVNCATPSDTQKIKIYTCPTDKPRTDFQESIEGLKSDVLYCIDIAAWENGSNKTKSEKVLVKETPGSTSGNTTSDGKFRDLLVARVDVPLRTAEIHRHVFSGPAEIGDINNTIQRKTGCQKGFPDPLTIFSAADPTVGISGLATRGFASGQAIPNPHFAERYKLLFNSIQPQDSWEWTYTAAGKSYQFIAPPVSALSKSTVASSNSLTLSESSLGKSGDTLTIDPEKKLDLTWEVKNPKDNNFISVQIGSSSQQTFLYCLFPAAQNSGSIEAELLKELPAGKHALFVQLESFELEMFPGTAQPSWILATYDWKKGNIEK